MPEKRKHISIIRGLRTIEWLKNQLLSSVSIVFISLTEGCIETAVNALADIIIGCYLLARRLNVSFTQLEVILEEKIRGSREEGHDIEQLYGDISNLLEYLRSRHKG